MKKIVTGILAHVDAGKTTLSEGMLYLSGAIRSLGRVDHKDTFLDTFQLEKARGITIFSKQANFIWKDMHVSLLDTPGHIDFSAEMERTLSVLDYAILVVSAIEGIQGHTKTLWYLLREYNIPTFIFVNKMDIADITKEEVIEKIRNELNDNIIDFSNKDDYFYENLAMCDEEMLEQYMENGSIDDSLIKEAVINRQVFPCMCGSALKLDGVEEFVDIFYEYTRSPVYSEDFGARVFKITRDEKDGRLTHVKITGGKLSVKEVIKCKNVEKADKSVAKVDQIRIYNGSKYETVREVSAGMVCTLMGLDDTYDGEGLGFEDDMPQAVLEAVLTYRVYPVGEVSIVTLLEKLRILEEEEPQLHVLWNEALEEIHVQVMGEIQIEILKSVIMDRFNIQTEFGAGGVLYKETIESSVEGVGHFEPLRHYAEVHLLLEPLSEGSGLEFATDISEDYLDKNWQRIIYTHLKEKEHLGVLTGSPITDMKITLINGRAHLKHTEGGDFRQATYRAVRNGLKRAKSILLEPYYSIELEVPSENIGRAMTDLQQMNGKFEAPLIDNDKAVIKGSVPVAAFFGYPVTLASYTKGKGKVTCRYEGYGPCHNTNEVIEKIAYDSELDLENPTGSVFCSHGAGFTVSWDEVDKYMHLPYRTEKKESYELLNETRINAASKKYKGTYEEDKELEEIFRRTFGDIKRKRSSSSSFGYEKEMKDKVRNLEIEEKKKRKKTVSNREEFLLVDGYNIIFAWEELNELAKSDLSSARDKLMDLLSNYQGFKKCNLILVFDAYKVKGNPGEVSKYHNIDVVYTKEAETADMYIEKTAHKLSRDNHVRVATSDGLEQMIIIGQGALRLSARDLKNELESTNRQMREEYIKESPDKNYINMENVIKKIKE